ncbi:SMI1/KNR4 family protein [Streptomyces sp. NPDC020875]|uniref:SMI1/KNR4 family protein n=1 Tax=Streptomyces sp. NPDC020875 TaxID=3154898 RepID=UPI0033EBF819
MVSNGDDRTLSPPVEESWARIDAWLVRHAPETLRSLRPPVTTEAIAEAERTLGLAFCPDLVASLLCHDGTDLDTGVLTVDGVTLSPLAGIVADSLFRRDIGRDTEEFGEAELAAYWRDHWVMITRGVAGDSYDGRFITHRPGEDYGRVGRFFTGDAPSFTEWGSLRAMLADLADALEHRRPMRGEVPIVHGGAVHWEGVPAPVGDPVSLLELAERAGEPERPDRPASLHTPYGALLQAAAGAETPSDGQDPSALSFVHVAYPRRSPAPYQPDVLFAEGMPPGELLLRMGVRPESLRERSKGQAVFAASRLWAATRPMVRAGTCGAWSFVVQEGGDIRPHEAELRRPEVLRRVSAASRAVLLYGQGNSVTRTVYEDGSPAADDEQQAPFDPASADPWGAARPLYARMLAELRPDFGIDFDPVEATRGELLSGLVLRYPDDLRAPDPDPDGEFELDPEDMRDFDLGAIVAANSDEVLRRLFLRQLRRLMTETGLDGFPEISGALDLLDRGEPVASGDDTPLDLRTRRIEAEMRASFTVGIHRRAEETEVAPDELRGWGTRYNGAEALRRFIRFPLLVGGSAVLHSRLSPDWRAEVLADLTAVRAETHENP